MCVNALLFSYTQNLNSNVIAVVDENEKVRKRLNKKKKWLFI